MTFLAILLLAAALAYGVSRWTGLPSVPLLILAGVGITALFPVDQELLLDALVLGLTLVVFTAGIELNPGRVRQWRGAAFQVGVAQFVLLGLVGLGGGLLLGLGTGPAVYLGIALSASSTLVVIRILQRRQLLFEPVGRLVTGVLLVQDFLVILFLPVAGQLESGLAAIASGVAATLGLSVLALSLNRWGAEWIVRRLAFDEESMLLLVLSILFGFLGLAWLLELPLVTGAFLAGVALSSFPANLLVRGQVSSLGEFFHLLFFVALGAFLPFPTMAELGQSLLLVGAVLLVTPPMVAYLAERAGLSARPAVGAGLLLSQTSEFSLVVGILGVSAGQIAPELLTIIALVTVLSMVTTPFLATDRIGLALMHIHPSRWRTPERDSPRDHILLLGCGRNGMAMLEDLIIAPYPVVVVDDDPLLVESLASMGLTAYRGDISDPAVLELAGAREARVVISTIRRVEDNTPLLQMRPSGLTLVRAFQEEDADRIRGMGAQPILYSQAAADQVMEWIDGLEAREASLE
jgi:CPA2 family monovalent cation:H+ antiporter-2